MLSKPVQKAFSQILQDLQLTFRRKFTKNHDPMMRRKELDVFMAVISGLQPMNCLEWGSGYSSLYFPAFIPDNGKWLSIEHEPTWAQKVQELNQNPKLEVKTVLPTLTHKKGDGTYKEFEDYIEYPSGDKYDLIIVDGRARVECVKKGKELLKKGGVILLHDANRKKYHEVTNILAHSALFTDHRNGYCGIWIGSDRPLEEVFDVDFHKKVWAFRLSLAKNLLFRKVK